MRLGAAAIAAVAAEHDATLVMYHLLYDPKAHLLPGRFGGQQPHDEAELLIWVARPDGSTPVLRRVDLARMRDRYGWSLADLLRDQRPATPVETSARGSVEPALPVDSRPKPSLYHWLIAPVADLLPRPGGQLVFVPQASLLLVPYAALKNAKGEILVDGYPIAVEPSVQVLQLTRKLANARKSQAVADRMANALIVGDPAVKAGDDSRALPRLQKAQEEARAIQRIWDAPEPLLGEAATEPTVRERMPQARLLHFAAHAELDHGGDGELPGAILLAPGGSAKPDEAADGLLTSAEIMDMKLGADLAVLSACQTGSDRVTGDGVIGLAYAFLHAGVPSLVASLWSVPDDATEALMTAFHQALAVGTSKAEALRQAMITTRRSGFDDPLQWSGFVLLGQW